MVPAFKLFQPEIELGKSLELSLFGFAIVFTVLIAIALLIILFSKLSKAFDKKKKEFPLSEETPTAPVKAVSELTLTDVDEKTAAVIMAIVSNRVKIPLERLQFVSIKEIKED